MKATDIDSLKSAWKNEEGFENKTLSPSDIEKFLQRKSKDISRLFKAGLSFDVVLKSIVGASLVGLIILFWDNQKVLIAMCVILGLILWTIWYQVSMYKGIPSGGSSDTNIRTSLERRIQFYHQRYVKSLYVGALSNSLIFVSGSLYYFYFKYGKIRPLDLEDCLVFGSAIIIAYVLGAVVQIAQHKFQIRQLESCLREIDEDSISVLTLKEQRNKKLRLFFIVLTALICGLLLLSYFIFR